MVSPSVASGADPTFTSVICACTVAASRQSAAIAMIAISLPTVVLAKVGPISLILFIFVVVLQLL